LIASLNNATGFYVTDWEDDQPSTDPDDKKFATESRKIREAALEINSLDNYLFNNGLTHLLELLLMLN